MSCLKTKAYLEKSKMPWAANLAPARYWAVTIRSSDLSLLEEAQNMFYGLGVNGLEWEDGQPSEMPFADIALDPGIPFVRAYFPEDELWLSRRYAIGNRFGELAVISCVNSQDWESSWKQYYVPIYVANRVIMPAWYPQSPLPEDQTIWLDPGMAFGTGTHVTTQMCLERITSVSLFGQKVMDLGSGSGVLAIAAAKSGAKSVMAVEPDSVAVAALMGNLERNHTMSQIEVVEGTLSDVPVQSFDVIVMNLITEIITEEWTRVVQYTNPNSRIVLSGIVEERIEEVLSVLEDTRSTVVWKGQRDEWVALEVTP